jgi:hypothetical protein
MALHDEALRDRLAAWRRQMTEAILADESNAEALPD